jgi:hypothetical protein
MKLSVALSSCEADLPAEVVVLELTAKTAATHLRVCNRVAGCVSGAVQVALCHAMLPGPAAQASPSAKQLPDALVGPEFARHQQPLLHIILCQQNESGHQA